VLLGFIGYLLRLAHWFAHFEPLINYPMGTKEWWRRRLDGLGYPIDPSVFTPIELGFYGCLIEFFMNSGFIRFDAVRAYACANKLKLG
jgi:hypothetical protein